ncbi:MAG: serine hydrolase domain-containing protein [Gemmatimonadota bacterium]
MTLRRLLRASSTCCSALLLLAASVFPPHAAGQESAAVQPGAVDSIFAAFDNTRTPGCVVGVSQSGNPVLLRAYGMAELEHGVPNTPETVFEPGSVSKQFTATATILLALDGRIDLEDDIRTYLPELPDYGEVVTIRHLLNHTSGLRDWGAVAGVEGWPRTRRAHTHTHVLDIASRQLSLNYPPGKYYSYTNTGYNLQAILVERVSGMSFARFSEERIFRPLGMTSTQWRDDFTRIVKDRAVAYSPNPDGTWSMRMPFEDVHGNGGLLTTAEDLLKFTQNLETGELWGPRYVEEMHRRGVLTSGQTIHYASGIQIGTYKGLPRVEHSGSTAGYRGHLTRFPGEDLALAVMCNAASGNAGGLLYRVADLYLEERLSGWEPPTADTPVSLSQDRLAAFDGNWVDSRRGTLVSIRPGEGGLRMGRTFLAPLSETRYEAADGTVVEFGGRSEVEGRPSATMTTPGAEGVTLTPVPEFDPTAAQLTEYAGAFRSDEAEATFSVAVEGGSLVIKDRWGQAEVLEPLYPDAFGSRGTIWIYRRNASGGITGLSLSQSRIWDLRFKKLK